MGWLFLYSTRSRKELLEYLRRPERYAPDNELVRSSAVGNNHWYLCRHKPTGRVWIGLDLMKGGNRQDPSWGYKDLDESVGPTEVNCPITYLDEASPAEGTWASDWRERVRAHHTAKKARPKPAPGQVVEYGGNKYRLIEPWAPRKGWAVTRLDTGGQYRMRARQLAHSKVVQEGASA